MPGTMPATSSPGTRGVFGSKQPAATRTASYSSRSCGSVTSRPMYVDRRSSTLSPTMPLRSRSMTTRARRTEDRRRRLPVRLAVVADVLVGPLGQEPLHVADREGLVDFLAPARGLARRGAHRPADRRHRVGIERELPGFLELTRRGEIEVAAAVRLDRTRFLTGDVLLIPLRADFYDLIELSHGTIRILRSRSGWSKFGRADALDRRGQASPRRHRGEIRVRADRHRGGPQG